MTEAIRILPPEVVDKIAAGEVVERPASVVKELMENSLDAGARSIEVELAGGGLQLVRVSDDGQGMSRQDLGRAVQRHATSKIRSYQDLLDIGSYGFRGEALSSIAAVSRLTLVSRPEGEPAGWCIECRQGEAASEREQAAGTGTTVTVEDLFGAVPARKKFLRSQLTEVRKATDEVVYQALANPGTGFRLVVDGRTVLDYRASDSEQRMRDALGDELFGTLTPAGPGSGGLALAGYVSRPGHLWPRRREQHLFVNGRKVWHRTVHSAVYQAYGPSLSGRHPAFVLFLTISPRSVDVNVHPAKREVRFKDEEQVFRSVRSALEQALFKEDGAITPTDVAEYPQRAPEGWAQLTAAEQQRLFELALPASTLPAQDSDGPAMQPLVQYWQVHNRYIFASIKNGIILVDQHAAHERILYEELLGGRGKPLSQQLIFPVTLELTPREMSAFEEYREVFGSLGFDISRFSGNTVVIEGLPASAGSAVDSGQLLRDILDDLERTAVAGTEPAELVARSFACHGAVRAGQALSQEEMNRLFDRLFATSSPYLDPHGRPAIIKMTLEDLERRFGRV